MIAQSLVVITTAVHFAVLGFIVFGGFLAWRWRGLFYAHLALAAWGLLVITFPVACPLTSLENLFRRQAGLPELGPSGFIDTYIDGVWYPEQYGRVVQVVVAALVLTSWIGLYLRRRGDRGASRSHGVGAS
ncbi:DUF2784 domain-containing protein [Goodfellowiella coeruleoviolacea]|uniref:DUF2784 domain-containing protein n=1 Tax=Goodfellowiella coeruleoviolacea TaxID=334858 RepID=A0AAE3GF71_9PSEU|nr:DUF2784 domain-containing protein [Goodfellowiella coeruleoviolacea]MCP2166214.1 Protein of Unknown function (DUF2784) [Goodfellowiella coeruleoviolacea]